MAAIGVDDDDYGMRLRAFVVKDGDVDEDTLKSHVKENLARYKVPRDIIFLDELPAQRDRQGARRRTSRSTTRRGIPAGVTIGCRRSGRGLARWRA